VNDEDIRRVHEAGAIIIALMAALPPTEDDTIDWAKVAAYARQLLQLAES